MDLERDEHVYSVSNPEDFTETRKYAIGNGSETFSYEAFISEGFFDSLNEFDL